MTARFSPLPMRVRLRGLNLEKALNALQTQGVVLRSLRRLPDRSVVFICRQQDGKALDAVCARFSCVRLPVPPPFPSRCLLSLKKRKGLWIGAFLFFLLVIRAMGYIWFIDVAGAGAYAGDVRLFLSEEGVTPGTPRASVSLTDLEARLTWRFPRVAWVRLSYAGVSLRVAVYEGTPPPDAAVPLPCGDVIAAQDGLVESLVTSAGTPAVRPGSFVRAGQVLISGFEKGANGESRPVKAAGTVYARVWLTRQIQTNAFVLQSVLTGRSASRNVLYTPFGSFSTDDTPSFLTAERTVCFQPLGGVWIPACLVRETYTEVALEKRYADDGQIADELRRAAALAALSMPRKDDVVIDKWAEIGMIDAETWAAQAVVEVRRDIGRFQSQVSPTL